jgi:hypothetical protein
MIKYQYKILLVVIILSFVSSLSYADVSDVSINKLLTLSGLTMQITQFPDLIKEGLWQAHQQRGEIPDYEFSLLLDSIDKSVIPSEIIEEVKVSIKRKIDEKEAKKLLVWYESSLAKTITAAENSASTPEAYGQMMQSAQSLLANQERVGFANRFDALVGATDMAMNFQEHTSIAVYTAIMTVMNPGEPLHLKAFKSQMNLSRVQTREAINQMITISFLYAYKNISTENLKKYETFLNDDTTKKFNKSVIDGMYKGLDASVSKCADEIAKTFKNSKQQS